jgi:hypothetical protein
MSRRFNELGARHADDWSSKISCGLCAVICHLRSGRPSTLGNANNHILNCSLSLRRHHPVLSIGTLVLTNRAKLCYDDLR